MPKVSIVIPVYNVEKYLEECLNSVINQTFEDLEILCVNDGSTDNSLSILNEFALHDKRIRVLSKENGGYGQAVNVGIEYSTGDYIGLVEPDDYIAPEMFEKLYNLAVENDADIVKSSFYENLDSEYKKQISKIGWCKNYELPDKVFKLEDCPIFLFFHPSVWSCLYKKSFLKSKKIKFVEAKGAGWSDNPFQVATLFLAERIVYTNEAYYYWRKRCINPSDDLKDYLLPFVRSDEIHEFLNRQKNVTSEMLNCLSKREIAYMNIALGIKNIKNKKDFYERIKKMCTRIYSNISLPSKYFTEKELKLLNGISKSPRLMRLYYRCKAVRKNIFSLHLTKNDLQFRLFGFSLQKKF